jgi:hypothetical protein
MNSEGGAAPPGQHAKGKRKPSPRDDSPAFLGHLFPISLTALSARARHLFDTKVALHRRGSTPKEGESPAQEMTARLSLVASFPSL